MMLDLSMFYTEYMLENYGNKVSWEDVRECGEQLDRFIAQCVESGIIFEIIRMPHLKWDTKRTDLNELILKIGNNALRHCSKLGCKALIVQPLFSGIGKQNEWIENCNYFWEWGRVAQEYNICILLENQCGNINGHLVRGVCADVNVVTDWIDMLNSRGENEVFGFCLDTGAANLCGQDMGEMAVALGDRLKAVLIRECDGVHEARRMPFTGMDIQGKNIDWASLIRGLRKIDFNAHLIFDVQDTLMGFSPLLREKMYTVAKSVADFFSWQVTLEQNIKKSVSRVLFGAGKMCWNYMRCYGGQYPPMFISDNNEKLWGTQCHGVEVKPPYSLKALPKDCVVIICNTFYQEIAEQLKEMGITNITAFNDEYLPYLTE